MNKKKVLEIIPNERIIKRIFWLRGKKVMFDSELATMYGVETKVFNQAVKRNIERFPEDFMFQLTVKEFELLRSQIVTSRWGGSRYLPYAFTEQGVAMLSSVLKSKRAIQVNIHIMRVFTELREMLLTHKDLREKIEKMERKYDKQFRVVFETIKQLLDHSDTEEDFEKIGFQQRKKK
jgi:hypothetical protein